jgi:hypothetical protein
MIENEKQLQVTTDHLINFQDAVIELLLNPNENPLLQQLYVDSTRSQIEVFKKEIAEYEAPKI